MVRVLPTTVSASKGQGDRAACRSLIASAPIPSAVIRRSQIVKQYRFGAMKFTEAPCARTAVVRYFVPRHRTNALLPRPPPSSRWTARRTSCAASGKGQQQTAEGTRVHDDDSEAGPSSNSTTLVHTVHLHACSQIQCLARRRNIVASRRADVVGTGGPSLSSGISEETRRRVFSIPACVPAAKLAP